jgi:hypothetical protein
MGSDKRRSCESDEEELGEHGCGCCKFKRTKLKLKVEVIRIVSGYESIVSG